MINLNFKEFKDEYPLPGTEIVYLAKTYSFGYQTTLKSMDVYYTYFILENDDYTGYQEFFDDKIEIFDSSKVNKRITDSKGCGKVLQLDSEDQMFCWMYLEDFQKIMETINE